MTEQDIPFVNAAREMTTPAGLGKTALDFLGSAYGIAGVGGIASSVLGLLNKPKKPMIGMLDPRQFKDEIVMDSGDLASVRNRMLVGARDSNLANVAAIKQAGAASGMAAGDILSAIGGSSYQIGKSVTEAEGSVQEMGRQSKLDYVNQLQAYQAAKAAAYNQGMEQKAAWTGAMTQAPLGLMSKALMMWRYDQGNRKNLNGKGENAGGGF